MRILVVGPLGKVGSIATTTLLHQIVTAVTEQVEPIKVSLHCHGTGEGQPFAHDMEQFVEALNYSYGKKLDIAVGTASTYDHGYDVTLYAASPKRLKGQKREQLLIDTARDFQTFLKSYIDQGIHLGSIYVASNPVEGLVYLAHSMGCFNVYGIGGMTDYYRLRWAASQNVGSSLRLPISKEYILGVCGTHWHPVPVMHTGDENVFTKGLKLLQEIPFGIVEASNFTKNAMFTPGYDLGLSVFLDVFARREFICSIMSKSHECPIFHKKRSGVYTPILPMSAFESDAFFVSLKETKAMIKELICPLIQST